MTDQNGGSPEPLPGGSSETAPGAVATATESRESIVPIIAKRDRSYRSRFTLIYAVLVLVLGGAVAGVFLSGIKTGGSAGPSGWSNWKPAAGTTGSVAKQIAAHVQQEYKLNKSGADLVTIVPEAPLVTIGTHKIAVSNIAIRTAAKSDKGIQVIPSGRAWVDQLCGITAGAQCSIPGKATVPRGQLVRREALEVALYTFKFVPTINTVVAFMPPPLGAKPSQETLLYLQRANLENELSQPLSKTLPLAKPPLPNVPDPQEQPTIDKLTLPAVYTYSYQQLQDASVMLVLNPFQS